MARYKTITKKIRLGKHGRRVKWAPFWTIPKAKGKGKRIHPSQLTRIKRHWRRRKLAKKIKRQEKRRKNIEFKSGRIKKKF
ncbi:MAG: hypothetical protein QXP53_02595 [Candidatus Pacearchaeota archaeon]